MTPISRTVLSNSVLNRALDLTLLVAVYWILYALPHCFSIPIVRIPLPPPFYSNTALATSIVSVSLVYIASSLLTRSIPPFFRMCVSVLVTEMGVTSYEAVHSSLGWLFNPTYGHLLWRFNLILTLVIQSSILYMFHRYLGRRDIKLLNITSLTMVAGLSYLALTLYQAQRGFYINVPNDHITLLQQTALFWMYPTLLRDGG